MSAEIVSLRRARKSKARGEKEARAARNRMVFGQPLAERRLRETNKQMHEKKLEEHRRAARITPPADKP